MGGDLNSALVEWLNKGLLAAWSPTDLQAEAAVLGGGGVKLQVHPAHAALGLRLVQSAIAAGQCSAIQM
eukprot:7633066-Pyramimonas_sp.AAC.2